MHLKKFVFASSDSHTRFTTHKANLLDRCFCHLDHQKIYLLGGLIKAQERELPEKRELICFVQCCDSD